MRKKALAKMLRKYPWLWAVNQAWDTDSTVIKVATASAALFSEHLFPRPDDGQVWLKMSWPGQDVFMKVRHETPNTALALPIVRVISKIKDKSRPDCELEYVVWVRSTPPDRPDEITIFKPPKRESLYDELMKVPGTADIAGGQGRLA